MYNIVELSIEETMAKHPVQLLATEGMFKGLAKQNMLFHQCIGELVDNAISATKDGEQFRINIVFHKEQEDFIQVFISDNGKGMPLRIFEKAIQIGESATTDNRLNEHGYGLKNALATLSSASNFWKMWTTDFESGRIMSVQSPFRSEMEIDDDDELPNLDFLPSDIC
jgi:sensor histidine kinase regulating citrate/malate metabolism